MTEFLSDQDVAERVLGHIDQGTTDRVEEVWREPVDHYRSHERLAAEVALLRRTPVAFCPSAALPEKGSYLARDAAGTPIIAVRGRDRRVRAFRNACRHRGTPLATGQGCSQALVCPYHAWSYKLDGRLQHVPHEKGFPDLDKDAHGLVPVATDERLGLVFVSQDSSTTDESHFEGLPEILGSEQRLLEVQEADHEINWKVYLEGFIEGYHIRPTHPESFYPYGFDNLNVVERVGWNSRITYPFRRIEKLRDVPPAQRRVEGLLTYVYHLFPNVVVTILSRHTNVLVLEPLAVDRTRLHTYVLANRGEDPDSAEAKRDAAFVNDTGAAEDLAIVNAIQRSIGSGANDVFTFGHFESLISHFHRNLTRALEG